jgi:hypothetical protein
MTRTKALVGAILVAIILAGCLIKGPEPVPPYYSNIRIYPSSNDRPPMGLEPAPAGQIYQFWLLDYVFVPAENTIRVTGLIPSKRFQWNSEYFFAISDSGETLGITADRGLDLGVNVFDHTGMAVSVEPLVDLEPDSINGPIILFGELHVFAQMNLMLDLGTPIVPTGNAPCEFSLAAPSYLSSGPSSGACWRDSSEGMGIWFASLDVVDREISDTIAICMEDTCPRGSGQIDCRKALACYSDGRAKGTQFGMKYVEGTRNVRAPGYLLWINPSQPESSFCNFDAVFINQEPDLTFRNGAPEHVADKMGPQIALGERPIIQDGQTVGYIYLKEDTTGWVDTCYLRIDIPESTHCTSDTFAFAPFNDTNVIARTFIFSWADTTFSSSLRSLAQPPEFIGGTRLMTDFLNLEYEAWVIFDSAGSTTKPISLGRFVDKNALDRSNTHFDTQALDPRFRFPGEDLLHGINRIGLPSSNLDLLSLLPDKRVKIWITLEPRNADWAPDEPYRQLIMYSADLVTDTGLAQNLFLCGRRGEQGATAPPVYSLPLTFKEVSATSASLNEGHNWPTMRIVFRPPNK